MLRLLAALAVTVTLGLLSRLRPVGWPVWDKSLGDVLYAVAAYLVLALLLSRGRPSRIALLALSLCLAVEVFKTTGLPAQYGNLVVVRWLLGTTFSWHNLACYLIGVTLVCVLDVLLLRPSPLRGDQAAGPG